MFKLAEVALQAPSNSPAKRIGPTHHCSSGRASKKAERRWEPFTISSVPSIHFTLNDMVDFKQEGD